MECNRDHHSEFLRAGMHAPPASCQRELTLSTKSRQREEALDGLKHGLWTLECVFRGNVGIHRAHGSVCLLLCVCVYYCRTFYKAVRVGEEESGGHVL